MAASHLTAIGSAMYSFLSFHNHTTDTTPGLGDTVGTTWAAYFAGNETDTGAAGTFTRIKDVRGFPAIGTPSNVVNVPVYGSSTSSQIQGQADLTSLEVTINYIPNDWLPAGKLGSTLAAKSTVAWRFTLLLTDSTQAASATKYSQTSAGLGTVPNSSWFWRGKMEAMLITPSLTDTTTATLTLTVQSSFFGPFTI